MAVDNANDSDQIYFRFLCSMSQIENSRRKQQISSFIFCCYLVYILIKSCAYCQIFYSSTYSIRYEQSLGLYFSFFFSLISFGLFFYLCDDVAFLLYYFFFSCIISIIDLFVQIYACGQISIFYSNIKIIRRRISFRFLYLQIILHIGLERNMFLMYYLSEKGERVYTFKVKSFCF